MWHVNWGGPLTKGRQVYCRTMDGRGGMFGINYRSGFLIGWDRWSDGFTEYESRNIAGLQ